MCFGITRNQVKYRILSTWESMTQYQVIYAIEEPHHSEKDVVNTLVAIDADGKEEVKTLHSGHDFYASIALSPDGTQIAFLLEPCVVCPIDLDQLSHF